MKNVTFTLLLTLVLLSTSAKAQYQENPNALAFRMTWANFQFPINNQKLFSDDYNIGVELSLIRHLKGNLSLAIPLKIGIADLPTDKMGNVLSGQLIAGLDALLHYKFLNPDKLLYPYFLGGAGVMTETENNWKTNMDIPLGFGINVRIVPHVYLSVETQYRFSLSENRSQLQHLAGIWVNLGTHHSRKIVDSDKDGLPDKNDECPNEPGPALSFGCPDTDGDGVPNYRDDCPTVPGPAERRGCPAKDTDGDGVLDEIDKCPNTPGPASNQGCPELKQEEKDVFESAMRAVRFETASAKLLSSSYKVLDEIVAILKKYSDHKLRIEGHTDSIGTYADNQVLSEKRAKSCYDYLVNKGIKASRITHKGFGERRPIDDNRFAPGREKNRRVEFHIYIE